ncbi:hypothetical protein KIN20_018813 [Parelaphostrongylus tenuis]|uniref:Uncharacterized protein n=1 Tax=Parelaphostrongylus tenuis TaxID=148309 RepID=A0AAD5MKJ1_PARTN|nr:hypothetical protein KIN20_018813 [Parelaphostrongylus tenuis]
MVDGLMRWVDIISDTTASNTIPIGDYSELLKSLRYEGKSKEHLKALIWENHQTASMCPVACDNVIGTRGQCLTLGESGNSRCARPTSLTDTFILTRWQQRWQRRGGSNDVRQFLVPPPVPISTIYLNKTMKMAYKVHQHMRDMGHPVLSMSD